MGVVFGENVSGGTFDGLVTQMDILPTLLDVTGHPDFEEVKGEFDGKSLQSILMDPMASQEERSLFWHYPGYRGMTFKPAFEGQGAGFDQRPETAIRRGRWKMIQSLETGNIQLYDLYSDIPETRDISKLYPEIVRSLKLEVENWRNRVKAPMPKKKRKSLKK